MSSKKLLMIVLGMGSVVLQADNKAVPAKDGVNKSVVRLSELSGKTDLKIRFVESFDTMRQCEQGGECGKKLEETRNMLSKSILEDEQKLAKEMTEFQSKSATLSSAAREKEEKRLRKMKTDYDTKLKESEYEMKLAMQNTTELLAQNMESAVVAVAKREKIDAVVDTVTGRVLYADASLNITSEVVKEMNNDHREKLAQANKAKSNTVVAANTNAPTQVNKDAVKS